MEDSSKPSTAGSPAVGSPTAKRIWGPWATVGLGLAIGALFVIVQVVVATIEAALYT